MSHSDNLTQQQIENLIQKKQLTRTQTRLYCQDKLGIGRTLYYRNIYPKLKKFFTPLIVRRDERGRAVEANVIKISKKKVDEVIALHKKRVEDRAKN
ncbi:hypothetical protein [Halalkalibaculum sp. DA384]|uniref:hypothetical protein n=1 Tax=Halalkalibaculum sp. DA384 TaxID=3373606 RepID=UPI003754F895